MKVSLTITDDKGKPFSGEYEVERGDLRRSLRDWVECAALYFDVIDELREERDAPTTQA